MSSEPTQESSPKKTAPRPRQSSSTKFKAIILVVMFVLLWPLLELGLFVLGKTVIRNDFISGGDQSMLQYEMKPGELYRPKPGNYPDSSQGTRINSLGYRGPEIGPKKEGTTRILAMGDSTVFGLLFGEEDSWPSVLQKRLAGDGLNVEVINMGRVAASSNATRFDLEHFGEQLQPDALIISVGWYNDYQRYTENSQWSDEDAIQAGVFQKDWETTHHSPWMASRIYRILRGKSWDKRMAEQEATRLQWVKDGEYNLEALDHPRRVPIDQFEKNLRAMCEWAKAHNIPIFFTTPVLHPFDRNPSPNAAIPDDPNAVWTNEVTETIVQAYAEAIHKVLGDCDGILIDTRNRLLKESTTIVITKPETFIWIDYVHLWPLGNKIMSDEIHQALMEHRDLITPKN